MSGHSKWATTKHQKAAKDAKRGKAFAKLIKTNEVAARTGGGDPAANHPIWDIVAGAKLWGLCDSALNATAEVKMAPRLTFASDCFDFA